MEVGARTSTLLEHSPSIATVMGVALITIKSRLSHAPTKPNLGTPGAPETECTKGLVTKCQSSQFFLIIGVLAHILSIPTPFIPKIVGLGPVPNLVGLVLVFLAAFSYFIVWCVWAYLINTKYSSDKISCGVNVDGIDENLGGAFACTIIAWLLCTAQAVLFVLGRNDSTDAAYGSGKKQTKADKKASAVMEAPPADEIDEDAVPQGDDDDL
eukprot:m.416788 g.416788  ORF g.416788 m.416788 type:complete len:212 (-) comp30100_c0_seq1:1827-2462(-)